MKEGLEPIIDDSSRILIMGSLPSDASLTAREYYAHPRNHFWRILSCIHDEPIGTDYGSKRAFLRRHGIALWDVLKAAERKGSLDSNIRSPVINDLEGLIRKHPRIRAIGVNGTKAWNIFNRHWRSHCVFIAGGMPVRCLPSSSPVPGRNVKSLEEKIKAWRELLALAA
ncbi:MAG: DNA-deoxyinosine glycosylase [Gammaproteobacteria bacterium]|nr:DNA-deoxyinosine glycosylase [Gammaproteobacteria bacterium]